MTREDAVHERAEFERYSRWDGKPVQILHGGCDLNAMMVVFHNPSSGMENDGQQMKSYCCMADWQGLSCSSQSLI